MAMFSDRPHSQEADSRTPLRIAMGFRRSRGSAFGKRESDTDIAADLGGGVSPADPEATDIATSPFPGAQFRVIHGGRANRVPRGLTGTALTLPQKPRVPRMLYASGRGLIDLGSIAAAGLVLFTYPAVPDKHDELDLARYESFAARREQFEHMLPGGALVAATATSQAEQIQYDVDAMWEQAAAHPRCTLISDPSLHIAEQLAMPTIERDGRRFYDRATLIARDGLVEKIFHLGDPARDARKALAWLQLH